ncbi:MAG: N-acetyltransferase [Fusobacteriaceae bacterium]
MIRNFKNSDIERIMELWLKINIVAHSFVKEEYWKDNFDTVREMMPNATIYIWEEEGTIQGFIGLIDDYIAGIFISDLKQSKGVGVSLLNYVKKNNDSLSLKVYKKNSRAVKFYLREGFNILNEEVDENTGEEEFSMYWEK